MSAKNTAHVRLDNLAPKDLQALGLHYLAYIKSSAPFGEDQHYTIHSADGKKIAHYTNYQKALDALKSSNLHLITVH